MSQAEIDALMGGGSAPAAEPGPMSQEEIEAFMAGGAAPPAPAAEENLGPMSQAEIDALMGGGAPPSGEEATIVDLMAPFEESTNPNLPVLTDLEKDAMGEIGNISMGTAATTLAVLLGRRVSITTPKVSVTTFTELKKFYPIPCLVVEVGYTTGVVGTNLLTIQERDALIIASLMMGGDGLNPPMVLDELSMSAVAESMNQMMGSTATSLSTIFKKKVDIAPPKVNLLNIATDENIANVISGDTPIVRVSFRMEVEDLIDSYITQILPYDVAQSMVENLTKVSEAPKSAPPPPPPPAAAAAPPPPPPMAAAPPPMAAAPPPMAAAPPPGYYAPPPPAYYPPPQPHLGTGVPVQPAQFQQLSAYDMQMMPSNIDLIMDVPLQVTVELGRTRKLIREILEFNPGSVIELDKLAGEPVDVLVNGKLIAKGEVVVIDENFGVRITYISTPADRLSTLQ
jgi:flagellar motor switch protein FliN/FliY